MARGLSFDILCDGEMLEKNHLGRLLIRPTFKYL